MPNYIRLKELLNRIPITEGTVRRWVKSGRFPPPARIEGVVMWDADEVNQWLNEHKDTADADPR